MEQQKKLMKAAFGVLLLTFSSNILGFFREILLGSHFGATYETDAYVMATTIPSILFTSILTAVTTSFIPVYSKVYFKQGKEQSLEFTNKLLNIVILITILLSSVGTIFARPMISLIGLGFDKQTMELAIELTRFTFPMIIFIGISKIFTGFLQSNNQFLIPAFVHIPNNLMIIIGLILSTVLGIQGVVFATLLGAAVEMILLIPWMKGKGYKYQWLIDLKDPRIRYMGAILAPILIGTAVQQINALIDRMLASGLAEGSIAALSFANRLNIFAFGIITIPIMTVLYPMLSDLNAAKNIKKFKDIMISSLNTLILFIMPIIVMTILFAKPIIQILFEHGAFDERATAMTSSALVFYGIGMLAFGFREILTRVFFSIHDTKTPMINGVIALGVNIILNVLFIQYMAHNGLALASSLAEMVASLLLFLNIKKAIGTIEVKRLLNIGVKSLFSSTIMGIAVWKIYGFFDINMTETSLLNQIMILSATVLVGILMYLISIYLLKVEEFRWGIRLGKEKIALLYNAFIKKKEDVSMECKQNNTKTEVFTFEPWDVIKDGTVTVEGLDSTGRLLNIKVKLKRVYNRPILVGVIVYDKDQNIKGVRTTKVLPPENSLEEELVIEGFNFLFDDDLFTISEYDIKVVAQYC